MVRKFHNIEQNTDGWLDLRAGKFTSSAIKSLFMKKSTKGYIDTIKRVAIERLSNEPVETSFFGSGYTERGHELESLSVAEYEEETFNKVSRGGFFELIEGGESWVGSSPDGIVNENNGLEIKNPGYSKFLEYLFDYYHHDPESISMIEKEFNFQCQSQIYVCGFEWVDLIVCYPGYNQIKIRIMPNKDIQEAIKTQIEIAKVAVNDLIEQLTQYRKEN